MEVNIDSNEDEFEADAENEEHQRKQGNKRRKVDSENECKVPILNRSPWNEADLKVKRLIFLSLGAEICRTFHQRNPNTKIGRCSTHELVHELQITMTRTRNTNFDRFQIIKAMEFSSESLETFYSRLRAFCYPCKFENMEGDLVKDLFISNMRSSNIQIELLSEIRTPQTSSKKRNQQLGAMPSE